MLITSFAINPPTTSQNRARRSIDVDALYQDTAVQKDCHKVKESIIKFATEVWFNKRQSNKQLSVYQ